jgi:DNA-binding NtrC family response regulator
MKVLIVHEERVVSDYFAIFLRNRGCETLPLYSSRDAFEHLPNIQFDIAMISTVLSPITTEELATLFADPAIQPKCRVILFGTWHQVVRMRESRPEFDYFEIPFKEEELLAMVRMAEVPESR